MSRKQLNLWALDAIVFARETGDLMWLRLARTCLREAQRMRRTA